MYFPTLEIIKNFMDILNTIKNEDIHSFEQHLLIKKNSLWFGLKNELTLFDMDKQTEKRFVMRYLCVSNHTVQLLIYY